MSMYHYLYLVFGVALVLGFVGYVWAMQGQIEAAESAAATSSDKEALQ